MYMITKVPKDTNYFLPVINFKSVIKYTKEKNY